jgi:hypothetical protein
MQPWPQVRWKLPENHSPCQHIPANAFSLDPLLALSLACVTAGWGGYAWVAKQHPRLYPPEDLFESLAVVLTNLAEPTTKEVDAIHPGGQKGVVLPTDPRSSPEVGSRYGSAIACRSDSTSSTVCCSSAARLEKIAGLITKWSSLLDQIAIKSLDSTEVRQGASLLYPIEGLIIQADICGQLMAG